MFRDNSHTSRIVLSLIMIKHIIKNNKLLKNAQMAYIRLEPKSSQHN